jgi:hypothetical protein
MVLHDRNVRDAADTAVSGYFLVSFSEPDLDRLNLTARSGSNRPFPLPPKPALTAAGISLHSPPPRRNRNIVNTTPAPGPRPRRRPNPAPNAQILNCQTRTRRNPPAAWPPPRPARTGLNRIEADRPEFQASSVSNPVRPTSRNG